jgi:hypothetical protein
MDDKAEDGRMSDALPEISETCRCGASTKLVGDLATDDRLKDWREGHRCMSSDEVRFRDLPQSGGPGGAVIGFKAQWDYNVDMPLT